MKKELSARIANCEQQLDRLRQSSEDDLVNISTILAHARQEWAHGNLSQATLDVRKVETIIRFCGVPGK